MIAASGVVTRLLEANRSRVDTAWFDTEASRAVARVEAYWTMLAERLIAAIHGCSPVSQLRVGRPPQPMQVTAADWDDLDGEFERCFEEGSAALRVLRAQLLGVDAPDLEAPVASLIGAKPLAIIVLIAHLSLVERKGPSRDLGYRFVELQAAANSALSWIDVGAFNEVDVAFELFGHAGMSLDRCGRLFHIPYHAFWRRLIQAFPRATEVRQGRGRPRIDCPLESEESRNVHAGESPPPPVAEPADADIIAALRSEITHLACERDALDQSSAIRILPDLFTPLLRCRESPVVALRAARDESPGLGGEILDAILALVERGDVGFTGEIGEALPNDTPPCRFEILGFSAGDPKSVRLVVIRRGLRWRDHHVAPIRAVAKEMP